MSAASQAAPDAGEASALCRDCLAVTESVPGDVLARCKTCGSPRVLIHPERDTLAIAHVDCDAFYAAIEKRDDPSLRDNPLIIGGGKRGVVLTCCYNARTFGVRSAMPMFKALVACPQAIVISPDMGKYARVGNDVRALMRALTPLVEPLSIDEAFLDLSGTGRLHGASPAGTLARFAHNVESQIGITVSIGLSYCKFLAKIASDLDKPRGFSVFGRAESVAFLARQPVGLIWGVGKVMQERLRGQGIRLMADLQRTGEGELVRRYGAEGTRLFRLAQGIDPRPVNPDRETKSISAETTFESDITDPQVLAQALFRLCERVSRRLKRAGLCCRSVSIKLKTAKFKLRTRARSNIAPTQLSSRIFEVTRELLVRETGATRFRLIGVSACDLAAASEADRGDLLDSDAGRERATEQAIDALRSKFGDQAIVKGIVFGRDKGRA